MTDAKKENILTPEFRVSFPYLFRPQAPMDGDPNKKPKYSVVALFAKGADLSKLTAAVMEAGVKKWGPKEGWPKGVQSPFRDQADKSGEEYTPGAFFCTLSSQYAPGVVNEKVEAVINEADVYAGCYGRATVNAFAWEFRGPNGQVMKRGISLGLQNFQKLRDGEPLSGRAKAEDEFQPVDTPQAGVDTANPAAMFG